MHLLRLSAVLIFLACPAVITAQPTAAGSTAPSPQDSSGVPATLAARLNAACGFHVAISNRQVSLGPPSVGAQRVVKDIVRHVGLPANFEVYRSDIRNGAAAIVNGKRLIIYDPELMARMAGASDRWSAVGVLAHEIGHHLSGHTLGNASSANADELQADRFAGFVLNKMGASFEEARSSLVLLASVQGNSSHPAKLQRLEALEAGWFEANELEPRDIANPLPPPPPDDIFEEEYFITEYTFDTIPNLRKDSSCGFSGKPEIAYVVNASSFDYWAKNSSVIFEYESGHRVKAYVPAYRLSNAEKNNLLGVLQRGRRVSITTASCGQAQIESVMSLKALPAVRK